MTYPQNINKKITSNSSYILSQRKALSMMETSYLSAATALIWIGLYYLPIGGAFFRIALPLPLVLLQLRRGWKYGVEGVALLVLLLVVLMGPVRGPLVLFPYGFLALWLGWSWSNYLSWWVSWPIGVVIGTLGFLIRVCVLSLLVGENLWVVITRAGGSLLERLVEGLNLPVVPDAFLVQLCAIVLVITQELIYILCLHAISYWIFPRIQASMPEPPKILNKLLSLDTI